MANHTKLGLFITRYTGSPGQIHRNTKPAKGFPKRFHIISRFPTFLTIWGMMILAKNLSFLVKKSRTLEKNKFIY